MGMSFTFSNIIQFFSGISSILLAFFMIMTSFFNQDIKSIIYLAGAFIAFIFNVAALKPALGNKIEAGTRSPICDIIDIPINGNFDGPNGNSVFIAYTLMYLTIPMFENNEINFPLMISIITLFGMDAFYKLNNKCTSSFGIVIGGLVGGLIGTGYYYLLSSFGLKDVTYFSENGSNNSETCSMPNKQTFKCAVYKNGELIRTL